MSVTIPTTAVESGADFDGPASRWIAEIKTAQRYHAKWHRQGEKIIKRFKDERPGTGSSGPDNGADRRINVLWSNIQTLQPTVYARTPKCVVTRRYLDKDPVGRVAAESLERATQNSLDLYDFDATMRMAVLDYLLCGRGQIWVTYRPEFAADGVTVAYERTECEHINWRDFMTNPARTWDEVWWVARRAYLTRAELVERFGEEIGSRVPLDHKPAGMDAEKPEKMELIAKATVYEVWDRKSRMIRFVHCGFPDALLQERPAPFDLEGFFPCPRPITATTANDSVIPVPDYALYQDQAQEMDDLTARIANLTKALKAVGVYDSSAVALRDLLNSGMENVMIPVDSWAAFAQGGGLKGAMDMLPIEQVARTVIALYDARDRVRADMYEVTGLSDIIRGASDPNETATAQGIKAQWGSIRVRDRQAEVSRFARDVIRIKAEIIAEIFEPNQIAQMAGIAEMPPEYQQLFPQAIELLRQHAARQFRIDIETDSTIAPDEQAEKQQVSELIGTVGGFLQQSLPVVQAAPPMGPVIGEMLLYAVRRFRAGRQLEQVIEQAMQQMMQPPPPAPPPQPDPTEQLRAQAEQVKAEAGIVQAQAAVQKVGMEAQRDAINHQNALQRMQMQAATGVPTPEVIQ